MQQKIFFSSFLLASLANLAQANETYTLSPLTVTATRSPQNSDLVSTSVISRHDIERLQLNTIEQALRGIAGINIANNGGPGKNTSVFLRGTEADHVLVLIDGVRVGSATTGSAAWQHLPMGEIESIEVIRGPKSSLYGADAIGGVIHIHTRNAQFSDARIKPVLSVGGGNYGHYRLQGGVSGKVRNAWYNVNLGYEDYQGFNACSSGLNYGCFTHEPDRDGYKNYTGSLRLGYQFTDWLSLDGHALYSGGQNEFDGSFVNQEDFTELVYGGQATIQATDFWRINLKGGESRDESTNFLEGNQQSVFDTRRISFSALNHFTLATDHLLSIGYDFQDDSVVGSTQYAEDSRNNHAGFIQYQGELYHHQLVVAYRADQNEQFGLHSTWNVSWGYTFAHGILVSASYATAFKAPTFNELYFPDFGNSALNPEKSESYEIGVRGEFAGWNGSLNGYLTYITSVFPLREGIPK